MSFVVTVRLVGRRDSEQPEPFFLGPGAEWTAVELMLSSVYGETGDAELDIRYWDDEDFVILSSQDELDEACRIADEKGILQIYVRSTDSGVFTPPLSQTSASSAADPVAAEEAPRERAPKRRADEAFTPDRPESGSAVDPSAPAVASHQPEDTAVDCIPDDSSSAAAAEASLAAQGRARPAQNQEGMDAGASDQEHRMVPGAPSGANVIAIEMPECPLEQQEVGGGDRQGTEAAEPAEMAETGEVAPKSGRDAETGFWMVPHGAKGESTGTACASSSKTTQNDVRPKQPVPRSSIQAPKKAEGKDPSGADRSQRKKKQQSDALTQEIFYVHMAKVKSELRREIVKDVTRKTVRQVVEGVWKLQASQQQQAEAGTDRSSLQESKPKWPVSFHERIICDYCDETIVGSRFKCGNCTNYDLCEACENIYPPVHDPLHVFLKLRKPCPKAGIRHGQRVALLKRTIYLPEVEELMSKEERRKEKADVDRLNRMALRLKVKEAKVQEKLAKREEKLRRMEAELENPLISTAYGELSAEFVKDETIPDGTIVSPGQQLEKCWVMRNNGTLTWPTTTVLELVQTNMPAKQTVEPVGPVQPGKETTITVHLVVPSEQGDYESHWRLNSKGQVFGHTVFCKVRVEDESCVPTQPKLITPKCETPVVGFSQADGISLLLRANEELAESAEQSQEKEWGQGEDGDKAESLISFLNPVMMPQHLDQPAPQGDDDVEAGDPWALSQSQAGPNLSASGSGSGAGPSPAVPSTPNNTPFAVSPPSGRCVSPPPPWFEVVKPWTGKATSPSASLGASSDHAFMLLKKKFGPQDATSEEDAEENETTQQNRPRWMFSYLVEGDSEHEVTDEPEEDSHPQNGIFENIGMILTPQLVPSAPVEDPDVHDQAEAKSVEAKTEGSKKFLVPHLNLQREDEEDAESCPELLFCDDFVMCPLQKVATKEDSAPDAESVDEELYASAPSAKLAGLEDWLEMPVVGPSPVMPSEEANAEILRSELCRGEVSGRRPTNHEVSPGSTTSSVEVVSVADLKELEKEEEYQSIDTHGAWFFPTGLGQPASLDGEKEDGEGYEILPDEFSSPSDDSSSDDDFCIVMPDCFDTSKPLRCDTPTEGRMERLYKICLKEVVRQSKDGYTPIQGAKEASDEMPESSHASEQTGEYHAAGKVSEQMAEGSAAEKEEDLAEKSEAQERADLLAGREEELVRIVTQALGLKVSSSSAAEREVEARAEKWAEEACEAGPVCKAEESSEEPQDGSAEDTEHQDGAAEDTEHEDGAAEDTEHQDGAAEDAEHQDGAAEDTEHQDGSADESDPVDGGAEETELKTEAKEEGTEPNEEAAGASAAAAASTAVVHVVDPGQQLNQLMQSTMKAASHGLQHLFQTTKDVIKTLQAETYEVRESKYEFKPSDFVPPKSTWQPADKQYVPPRNDFQPPKSDFQLPKSTYTGPKTPMSGGGVYSGEFAAPLQRIREMGCFNNELTLSLLKKHNGDIHLVVNELCMENENNWAENRH